MSQVSVTAGGVRFRLARAGRGPPILLLHGAGASSFSFRDLVPELSRTHEVIAPDLPGHGMSEVVGGEPFDLEGVARAVGALMEVLERSPYWVLGHSAGTAVLCRMCLDGSISPRAVVGINAALLPLKGWAGRVFSPVARVINATPLASEFIARNLGRPHRVEQTIAGTGSRLNERGVAYYEQLATHPTHIRGVLRMMAHWSLDGLVRDLGKLAVPLLLIAADNDRAVPPSDATRIASMVRQAKVVRMPGVGHLSHEERPVETLELVCEHLRRWGIR